ncbi:hypothetical protein D3C86_2150510 [compost metagenome]
MVEVVPAQVGPQRFFVRGLAGLAVFLVGRVHACAHGGSLGLCVGFWDALLHEVIGDGLIQRTLVKDDRLAIVGDDLGLEPVW